MAALQDQPISINYGKGLDTKTDPRTVQIGKMLRLENAVFTETNRINKRNGNDAMTMSILGGGTLSNPTMTGTFNNELVSAGMASGATLNGQRVFSYSTQEDRWVDKGRYTPVKATSELVCESPFSQYTPTVAQLGNIAVFASTSILSPSVPQGTISVSVWDMNTNTALLSNHNPAAANTGATGAPIALLLGGTQLAILYQGGIAGTYYAILRLITVTAGGGVVFGPQILLDTLAGFTTQTFDMAARSTATGAAISYSTSASGSKLITIDTAGTVLNTVSLTAFGVLAVDPNNDNIWVFWFSSNLLKDAVYSSTLSTVQGATTLVTISTTGLNSVVGDSITAISVAAHVMQIAYSYTTIITTTTPQLQSYFTYQLQANDSGSVTIANTGLAGSVSLYSDFFMVQDPLGNNIPYLCVTNNKIATNNIRTLQPTLFVMEATLDSTIGSRGVIARAFWESAAELKLTPSTFVNVLSPIVALSASKALMAVSINVQANTFPLLASEYLLLDFANQDTSQAVSIPTNMLFNGGIITSYDGQQAVEMGFNLFPEIAITGNSASGGFLTAGQYQIFATYSWIDGLGNLQQSAPSLPQTVTTTGSTSSIEVRIPNLYLTQKQSPRQDITINVYITEPNEIVPYLFLLGSGESGLTGTVIVNNPTIVTNSAGYRTITITTVTNTNPILYTNGGILDNDPPPPSTAMVVHNNRVQVVDSLNPNSQWYSKSMTPGTAVSFSGNLLNQIDPHAGGIVALAEMDDKLILLAQNAPIILSGDGANDAGQGSTLSFPQFIPSDVGCSQSKGVITSPLGVHFKTPKGLYLLDRSTQLKYWGYPVEAYNTQDVTNTLIMPGTTQIRFLTDNGLTLVYDYFQDQWGTFTNFQGVGATIWNGLYVYARADGSIYKENPTSFLDNTTPFSVKAQTAWLKGGVVQGFQRLKEYFQLGDFTDGNLAGHGMQVSEAFDYLTNPDLPNFTTPVPAIFASISSGSSFQYREILEQQKCEAVSFLIEEITTGASGESMNLADMTVVLGIKKGAFKVLSSQTVAS